MEELEVLKEYLAFPKDILLTSHRNPDGDAIGSCLGLYHCLIQMGHSVNIAFPSEFPDNFIWLPASEMIAIYDLESARVESMIQKSEVIFSLDYNSLDRIDKMGEMIHGIAEGKKIVMIDHHLDPEPFADFQLTDPSASSTCELVYRFIEMMGYSKFLNTDIATCIYTGIVTDTGSFKFNTHPNLFRVIANLLEMGLDDNAAQNNIYNSMTFKQLELVGHCLTHRMRLWKEYQAGLIYLTRSDYESFNIQRGDTEGIVNYLLLLKDVRLAFFVTEQPSIVKLSLRSKGDLSVQEICRKHFNGGGHKNASGGFSHKGLKNTLQFIEEFIPEYMSAFLNLKN